MTYFEKVQQLAESFQQQCHENTEQVIKNLPKATVQDCTNVWTFAKLAEFELRLRELESVVNP